MATLMNTRGLTELVILGVGLQLHILNKPLYSLMVIMALVTTAMSGPLLKAIYPDRVMAHDIAAESRLEVGTDFGAELTQIGSGRNTAERGRGLTGDR